MSKPDDIAIKVSKVSKSFKLPHEKTSSVKGALINVLRTKNSYEKQQVLNDISFEIKKGEFFGIVGRNGSGKSTLLKLLAGIYSPDKGHIQINGKLTPFIELGVGFNPDLTGRENVFLNGALLGFSRKEMLEMYDEIVEFAELENFMDQRLKNYSSGMQVRLAFSIAIRANTDILVLDEVLAVGDESFQRKCEEYFRMLKNDKTKTVILVTHSMDSMKKFCSRALLIRNGKVVAAGSPEDVANQYTEDNFKTVSIIGNNKQNSHHKPGLSEEVPYFKIHPKSKQVVKGGEDLIFEVEYEINNNVPVHTAISITDESRGCVVMQNRAEAISGEGKHKLKYVFPTKLYNNTDFIVTAVLDEKETYKRIAFTNESNSCRFAVRNKHTFSSLLNLSGDHKGYWEGHEEFIVDKEGKKV